MAEIIYVALGVVLGTIPFVLVLAGFYCASLSWRANAEAHLNRKVRMDTINTIDTIDGLTLEQVEHNIYAFSRDMRTFACKRDRSRTYRSRSRWQRKYTNAMHYFENNKERLLKMRSKIGVDAETLKGEN